MREFRLYGSVRGALSNERPYREKLQAQYDAAALELGRGAEPALAFATQGLLARILAGLFLPNTAIAAGGVTAAQAVRLAEAIADVEYSINMHDVFQAALSRWQKWHIAFSVVFYILLGIHIWSGLYYGLRWFRP